ncbi:hypothetical protein ACLKMH_13550 [Psychromonas sp. KJ10-10]|uniref:hypothetical protein n=1 Tax=Psychromonas sp. KJ10-10 TaxID=3391823 RepID=UPI0039B5AE02
MNFLLNCLQFEQFLQKAPNKQLKRLFFSAFENNPKTKAELEVLLNRYATFTNSSEFEVLADQLLAQYPLLVSGCHRLHFGHITLDSVVW